jgi:transcription antitermination factor NusG
MIDPISGILHILNSDQCSFSSGEKIRITNGAFTGFEAVLESISQDSVNVIVKIAGREVPVESKKNQIERLI